MSVCKLFTMNFFFVKFFGYFIENKNMQTVNMQLADRVVVTGTAFGIMPVDYTHGSAH